MNPITAGSSVNARNAFRQQYMNTLQLEIANQTKNLNANKLFKQNGTTGSEPPDTRSVTEKYGDIDALKREVRVGLREITDGRESELIVADITTAELQFLAGQLPFIIGDLKPKWKLGVPSSSFLPYLRKLMRKNIETEGVEYGLQRPADVGGGAIITAGELIRGEDIEDAIGELDNVDIEDARDERRMESLRAKLRLLFTLKPTVQDRQIMSQLGDPNILAEYDEDVTMASDTIPSEEVIFHILQMQPASALIHTLSEVLADVDFDGLRNLKEWVSATERTLHMGEEEEHERIDASDAGLPPAKYVSPLGQTSNPVYEQEELETPFGEPEIVAGVRGSQPPLPLGRSNRWEGSRYEVPALYSGLSGSRSDRPVRSLNPETDLPSDYVQQPNERDFQLKGFAEEESPEDFLNETYDYKKNLLMMYAEDGLFHEMDDQFLHMINALQDGLDVPEGDMDKGYQRFFRLKQLGGLTERGDIRGRPEFQDESGLMWATEEEDPRFNPSYMTMPFPSRNPPAIPSRNPPSRNPPPIPLPTSGEQGLMVPLDIWGQLSLPQKSNLVDEMLQQETFDEEEAGYAEALLAESPPQEAGLDHVYEMAFRRMTGEPAFAKNKPSPTKYSGEVFTGVPEGRSESIHEGDSPLGITADLTPERPPLYVYEEDFADLDQQTQNRILARAYDAGFFNGAPDDISRLIEKNIGLMKRSGFIGKPLAIRFYKDIFPALTNRSMIGKGLFTHGREGMRMGLHLSPHASSDPTHIHGNGFKHNKITRAKRGNIIFGMGLSVVPTPTSKVSSKNINLAMGIEAEPSYVPFGTHLLNKHKLKDSIVMMRTKKGGSIVNIPTQKVSSKLSNILRTIIGGGIPQFESVMDLLDDDKALLHRITKTSKVSDRISVPNPNKSKQEQEDNRFTILRGEIGIGNDNPEVIKEFKVLLLKFMREGRVPIGQGKSIMEELLLMGH